MSEAELEERGVDCDIFHVLANERRRLALKLVHQEDIRDHNRLARAIAAIENDIPRMEVSGKQRSRVYIGLYQSHLPKLDEAGLIEYDPDRGIVTPRDWTRGLLPLIEDIQRLDDERTYEPPPESPGIGLPGGYRVTVREEGDA